MKRILFSLLLFAQISACSFHSSQYDFFKNLIVAKNTSQKPEKNWTAYWIDMQIDLYAINLDSQIIFADQDINIFFKDKQIYKVVGLFPNNLILDIELVESNIIYRINGKRTEIDSCELGKTIKMNDLSERYYQSCMSNQSERAYENEIITNSQGFITSMQFKIHPDYPLLKLRIK